MDKPLSAPSETSTLREEMQVLNMTLAGFIPHLGSTNSALSEIANKSAEQKELAAKRLELLKQHVDTLGETNNKLEDLKQTIDDFDPNIDFSALVTAIDKLEGRLYDDQQERRRQAEETTRLTRAIEEMTQAIKHMVNKL
jgi:chromosome segregation ATPase